MVMVALSKRFESFGKVPKMFRKCFVSRPHMIPHVPPFVKTAREISLTDCLERAQILLHVHSPTHELLVHAHSQSLINRQSEFKKLF